MTDTLPVRMTFADGTVKEIAVADERELFGSIIQLLREARPIPLRNALSVEVEVWDDTLEMFVWRIVMDKRLDAWIDDGRRVVVYVDLYGLGETEELRGVLSKIDGWIPRYGLLGMHNATTPKPLLSDEVVNVRSASAVNHKAKVERNLNNYYKDKDKAHEQWSARYYKNHEASKEKNKLNGRKVRARQRAVAHYIYR